MDNIFEAEENNKDYDIQLFGRLLSSIWWFGKGEPMLGKA